MVKRKNSPERKKYYICYKSSLLNYSKYHFCRKNTVNPVFFLLFFTFYYRQTSPFGVCHTPSGTSQTSLGFSLSIPNLFFLLNSFSCKSRLILNKSHLLAVPRTASGALRFYLFNPNNFSCLTCFLVKVARNIKR